VLSFLEKQNNYYSENITNGMSYIGNKLTQPLSLKEIGLIKREFKQYPSSTQQTDTTAWDL